MTDADQRHLRLHRQREDEDPDHDRGEAVEDVEPELDLVRDARSGELAHVERDQDADRKRHRGCDQQEEERADECRGDAPARLAEDRGALDEEVPVERVERPHEYGADEDRAEGDGDERRQYRAPFGDAVDTEPPPRAATRLQRDGVHHEPPVR